MSKSLELLDNLIYNWYPTKKEFLEGFKNLITDYLTLEEGKVIDIGCGQSKYIIDLLPSKYNLIAVDKSKVAIDLLKKRIKSAKGRKCKVRVFNKLFSWEDFKDEVFAGVILINFLQFVPVPALDPFIQKLKEHLVEGSIAIITVHSDKHLCYKSEATKNDHFKNFFSEEKLKALFNKEEFDYVFLQQTDADFSKTTSSLLRQWKKLEQIEVYNETDPEKIKQAQKEFFKKERINSITLVVRKK